jgi:hypothetical protein
MAAMKNGNGRGNENGRTGSCGKKNHVVCPFCREDDAVIPILYGYPSDRHFKAAERGELYLGGDITGPTAYYCKRDDREF